MYLGDKPGALAPGRDSLYGLYSRGSELLARGHPHQAVMLLSQARLRAPGSSSIREALARALFNCGFMSRARREFTKIVELDPANDYAHFGLALACERTGQASRAAAHLKMAVAMRPDADDYWHALTRLGA